MPWFWRKEIQSIKRRVSRRSRRHTKQRLFHSITNAAILGAPRSGKTSIARRFSKKDFPDTFKKVTEIYNISLTTKGMDGILCQHDIAVHDTPGNLKETYPNLYEAVLRSSDIFILVFSLHDCDSMKTTERMLQHILRLKGEQVPVLIVANKNDIANTDERSIAQRFQFYKNVSVRDIPIVEVSAKNEPDFENYWLPILTEIEKKLEIRKEKHSRITIEERTVMFERSRSHSYFA